MKATNDVGSSHAPRSVPADRPRLLLLAIVVALSLLCGLMSVLSASRWVAFFAHPLVDAEHTRAGVEVFRFSLGCVAVIVPIGTLALFRLSARRQAFEQSDEQPIGRKMLFGLLALICVGFVARVTRIDESLWYDEIASWRTYNGGTQSFGAVLGAFLDPINHTLHTLLNRWSVQGLAGLVSIETAFRTPALIFSLATIPVMFGLGRASGGERVGWIAGAWAACSPVCVLEGVEARGYAQMMFFSGAASWALLAAVRRGSSELWLLYALCCTIGVWSQFVTAWIAIGHGAWLVWLMLRAPQHRVCSAQGLVALTLAGLASIAVHAPLIPGLVAWRNNFVAARPDQPRIMGPEGFHAMLQLGGSWYWWAAVPGLILFSIGLNRVLQRRQTTVAARSALAIALVGMPLMLGTVALSGTWLYARFMLFAVPGAILAIALGTDALWQKNRIAGVMGVLALAVIAIIDLSIRPPKQPLRDAVEFVREHGEPTDRIVSISLAHDVLSIYGFDLDIANSFMLGRDLDDKLDAVRPQWVIVTYPRHVARDRFKVLWSAGFHERAHFEGWADWIHGDVLVYSRDRTN